MRRVLTRQQLYDMIWERAVSKVAPALGISDVALRKQCVKHAIPLPDATYWGRLHAGRPVKRKEEETRRRDRWDALHRNDWDNWDTRPSIPYYDFTPTGEMAIEIAGWSRFENAQSRFADTRARKIESRVVQIFVSFAAFAAGRKVEREEARERARLEEIARQRRAEQARLAKLEQQRVEFLDRKLVQAEEQDRLRAFLMALPTDHFPEEASAYHAFIEWARQRLEKMEFQLQLATIAAEVSRMEAFASGSAIDNTRD